MTKKLTSRKARKILREGVARGHKLTKKQKRFFGLLASGKSATRIKKRRKRYA